MPWIKFLQNHTVQAAGGATYKEGQVVEVAPDSARHFTSRNLAEVVENPKPAAPKKADKEIEADTAPTGEDIKDPAPTVKKKTASPRSAKKAPVKSTGKN